MLSWTLLIVCVILLLVVRFFWSFWALTRAIKASFAVLLLLSTYPIRRSALNPQDGGLRTVERLQLSLRWTSYNSACMHDTRGFRRFQSMIVMMMLMMLMMLMLRNPNLCDVGALKHELASCKNALLAGYDTCVRAQNKSARPPRLEVFHQ